MAKPSRKKTTKKTPSSAKKASSRAGSKSGGSKKTTKKTAAKKAVAKKPDAKKTGAKKTAPKKSSSKKAAASKKTTKKASAKKTAKKGTTAAPSKPATKKSASKKAGKKPSSKTPAAKKPASKKSSTKSDSKKTAAKTSKKSASEKKPSAKKTAEKPATAKTESKSADSKKADSKKADTTKAGKSDGGGDGKKSGRKGITIVSDRKKRSRSKAPRKPFVTPGNSLLGPGVVRKPLIPSGPATDAPKGTKAADPSKPKKTPFNKRELTKFKNLLLIKRAELFGDIEQMEADALRSNSGNLSHLPQHLADQGSDSYEQSLSLDLAAADRRLIKEIDDALARIDAKTYGVCERTGKPIRKTRLQELPWARYSIEAARELERRGGF